MAALYTEDLAYIQAAAFGDLARGAAPEIIRLLQSAAISIRRVVDAGCGAGTLARALLDAGFEVTGIDSSAELLAIASEAAPGARFIHASIYDAGIPACEAIVALGEPLAYHADSAGADLRVRRFFQSAAAILPRGGLLIFDLIEPGEPLLAGRFWSAGEDWAVLVETTEDPSSRTLVRSMETFRRVNHLYRRGSETHRVRLFDAGALLAELAACGFETCTAQSYGEYRLAPRRRAFFCARL
jgi:SAM-dependent methyltransferase